MHSLAIDLAVFRESLKLKLGLNWISMPSFKFKWPVFNGYVHMSLLQQYPLNNKQQPQLLFNKKTVKKK